LKTIVEDVAVIGGGYEFDGKESAPEKLVSYDETPREQALEAAKQASGWQSPQGIWCRGGLPQVLWWTKERYATMLINHEKRL
jgi:hypothetical protein